MRILVADDTGDLPSSSSYELHQMPHESGVSYARNFLLKQVTSKYFVACDDDFIFTSDTKLEKLEAILDDCPAVSIAGGRCMDFGNALRPGPSNQRLVDGILVRTFLPEQAAPIECNMTSQFFMGRLDFFKANDVKWDERLKIGNEHECFFHTFPGRVLVDNSVRCDHYPKQILLADRDMHLVKQHYGFDIQYNYGAINGRTHTQA